MELKKESPTEARQCEPNAPGKFTTISAQKAIEIQKWINTNFQTFTDTELIERFNISIDDAWQIYRGNFEVILPKFSFYRAPVTNVRPAAELDLLRIYRAISGDHYKKITQLYRSMEPGAAKAEFKRTKFDHVTFSGTFSARKTENLKTLSGYVILDVDHVENPESLKTTLIADEILDLQMCFVSPSGDGLKIVVFNVANEIYHTFYSVLVNYLIAKYPALKTTLDQKTKDVARTCFICHDPDAYIKTQYLETCQLLKN